MAQAELFTRPEKKAPERDLAGLVHQCRTCGVRCGLSDDGGRTWQCREHVPADFFPSARAPAARQRRSEPTPPPVALPESDEF